MSFKSSDTVHIDLSEECITYTINKLSANPKVYKFIISGYGTYEDIDHKNNKYGFIICDETSSLNRSIDAIEKYETETSLEYDIFDMIVIFSKESHYSNRVYADCNHRTFLESLYVAGSN